MHLYFTLYVEWFCLNYVNIASFIVCILTLLLCWSRQKILFNQRLDRSLLLPIGFFSVVQILSVSQSLFSHEKLFNYLTYISHKGTCIYLSYCCFWLHNKVLDFIAKLHLQLTMTYIYISTCLHTHTT